MLEIKQAALHSIYNKDGLDPLLTALCLVYRDIIPTELEAKIKHYFNNLPQVQLPKPKPEFKLPPLPDDADPGDKIVWEVAQKHKMTVDKLLSANRHRKFIIARQEAVYRLVTELGMSLLQSGYRLNRVDHTTAKNLLRGYCARAKIEMPDLSVKKRKKGSKHSPQPQTEKIFRYVAISKADDYVKLGWVPRPALRGTHHGNYAVFMEWICCCGKGPMEPQ